MKKKGKETKIVYKANKKILSKIVLISLAILIVMFLYNPFIYLVKLAYLKTWKSYDSGSFGFKYELPRAYEKNEDDSDRFGLNSSAFVSEYSVEVNEEYVSQKPTVIFSGSNVLNGMNILLECLETPKVDLTLEEIEANYFATVKLIYDGDYTLEKNENQNVTVWENDGIRSSILFKKGDSIQKLITYLVPTDEKELTIMFFGDEKNINENEEEIEKIVSLIK